MLRLQHRALMVQGRSRMLCFTRFHEFWRAGMAPYDLLGRGGAKMFSAPAAGWPALPERHPHGRRLRAGVSHRQGLREARVRPARRRDRRRAAPGGRAARSMRTRSVACCASSATATTPATSPELKDDPPVLVVAPLGPQTITLTPTLTPRRRRRLRRDRRRRRLLRRVSVERLLSRHRYTGVP